MKEYEGKKVKDCTKEKLEIGEKREKEKNKEVCEYIKKELGEKVEKVEVSERLIESACIVCTKEEGYNAYMEKLLRA